MHANDTAHNACNRNQKITPCKRALPRTLLASAVLGGLVALIQPSIATAQTATPTANWNLPAGPLDQALNQLAMQSKLTISYSPDLVKGKTTHGLSGAYTPTEALRRLLAGTGLTFDALNSTTFVLRPASTPAPASSTGRNSKSESASHSEPSTTLATVTVTGTQIEGVHDIASPLSIYTREDIDQTGSGSVERFIQTLPQNFQGGASEGTVLGLTGGGTADNQVGGTGVNLRGLGNDATLVLLNGHRIAPGNVDGNFVDVSLIPVAALNRVEVMPDGASALYGSDAVGGVVNFITRKDYDGAETRVRYGGVTQGSLDEYQFAQTFGKTWDSGSALLSYEYLRQSALSLNDKGWVRDKFPGPYDLLPEQKRQALIASINQSIGDSVELYGDATYAKRSMPNDWFSTPSYNENAQANIDAWSADGGARVSLPNNYELDSSVSYAASDSEVTATNLGQSPSRHSDTDTGVFAWDTKLSGTLFQLPSGTVQFASGVHYQKESYRSANLLNPALTYDNDRNTWAAFAEIHIPLIGSSATHDGEPRLEATLAGRYDHYSDFGSTTNPKVGLIWRALDGLKFRGTWGTSFVAPLLSQLNPEPTEVAALLISDPTTGTRVPGLFVFGGNPDLQPEKAKTWTAGFDWSSRSLPGLSANATYYHTNYTNRITTPSTAFAGIANYLSPLSYPSLLGQFITRNPTLTEVQQFVDSAAQWIDGTRIPGGVDLSTIAALIDYRNVNLSAVRTSGVDFGASYLWHPGAASMKVGLDGTYILKLDNLLAPGVPVVEAADTVFNPTHLKLRARWTFDTGSFNGALFVNYVDSYRDTRSTPPASVASWTTVDANIGYRFHRTSGLLAGTSLTLGAINLLDRAPPYVAPSYSTIPGYSSIDFDGANADPRGRFVYLQVVKQF